MFIKRSKGKIFCFCGIDGSGKTTLAKYLVKTLKEEGWNCSYVYGRLEPFILKPFILAGRWALLKEKNQLNDYSTRSSKKKKIISKHPILFKIYMLILYFDYLWQVLFKITIPFLQGKILICDRYIFDTIVTDLAVDMKYSKEDIKKTIKKWMSIVPHPDLIFLIDLPEDLAFNRKDDTPSIEYLRERRQIYKEISEDYDMIILDGSLDLRKLKEIVKKKTLKEI